MATEMEQPAAAESFKAELDLKYLGFVHAAFVKAMALVASLYEFAKENSGPLKPGVDTVEGTVKTVVRPVYHKIEGKPAELLELVDRQVDEAVAALKQFLPEFFKEKSAQAYHFARQAPFVARSVAGDFQKQGVYESAHNYYVKYEPVAEEWLHSAWSSALKLPMVPQVVQVAAPSALFGVEKFNHLVMLLKDNKVPLAEYVPMLPLEKLERAVNMEAAPEPAKQQQQQQQ